MTPITATPELLLMLLADARLPVAGHTQSGGLEPAVLGGLGADLLPDYLATRLATVTRVEAGTAVIALHHLRSGLDLDHVEVAWAARTPSAAMRSTSRAQGRALLRLVRRLWPQLPSVGATPSRAVVLAAAGHACALSPRSLARLVGYDDVQTVASAALKLMPLDPATTTSWVYEALPLVDRLAEQVCHLQDPEQIPAAGAPAIEAWAEAHAVAERRLFSA
jgi:urease accessory protein